MAQLTRTLYQTVDPRCVRMTTDRLAEGSEYGIGGEWAQTSQPVRRGIEGTRSTDQYRDVSSRVARPRATSGSRGTSWSATRIAG